MEELHKFAELWPEFLMAWAGWMIHSVVHSATHFIRVGLRKAIGYLMSL